MEDPFLKIRWKVCGEWLVPPPVVAGNLKTFLHKFCSTQLVATCSIFPLICYMLMLVLLESTTRFWQDVAQADPHGLAWLSRDQKDGRLTATEYLSSSTRQKLTHGARDFSRTSIFEKLLFFPCRIWDESCCYCLKFTWNCLTNCCFRWNSYCPFMISVRQVLSGTTSACPPFTMFFSGIPRAWPPFTKHCKSCKKSDRGFALGRKPIWGLPLEWRITRIEWQCTG